MSKTVWRFTHCSLHWEQNTLVSHRRGSHVGRGTNRTTNREPQTTHGAEPFSSTGLGDAKKADLISCKSSLLILSKCLNFCRGCRQHIYWEPSTKVFFTKSGWWGWGVGGWDSLRGTREELTEALGEETKKRTDANAFGEMVKEQLHP